MAATVGIQIVVDDQGAIHAFQQTGAEIQKIGVFSAQSGKQTGQFMQQMQKDQQGLTQSARATAKAAGVDIPESYKKAGQSSSIASSQMQGDFEQAHDAVRLFNETLGLRLPRTLEKVIARSPVLGGALSAAFQVAVVAAFAEQIIRLVGNLELLPVLASRARDSFLAAWGTLKETFGGDETSELAVKRLAESESLVLPFIQKQRQLRTEAAKAGLEGYAALRMAHHLEIQDILTGADEASRAAFKQFGRTLQYETARTQIREGANQAIRASNEKYAAEERSRRQHETLDIIQAQGEAVAATKLGLDKINAERDAALKLEQRREQLGIDGRALAEAKKLAIVAKSGEQERQLRLEIAATERAIVVAGVQAILASEASGAHGREQIERGYVAKLQTITQEEESQRLELKKKGIEQEITFDDKRVAARIENENKLRELTRQTTLETLQLERQAAVAMLPPWQRGYAEIAASAQERISQIEERWKRTELTGEQAGRQIAAVWQEEFAQVRDKLTSDIENVFDSITSGNIGQTFLKMFKHMIAQMIATWMLGMRTMQGGAAGAMGVPGLFSGNAGGGGGLFSNLFRGLFGGNAGGGGGGTTPFFGGNANLSLPWNEGNFSGTSLMAQPGVLSGGMGAIQGTAIPGGAAGIGGGGAGGGILAGLLRRISGLGGLGGLGLMGLLTGVTSIGFGSPLRGAISGGMLGASAGLLLGPMMGFLLSNPFTAIAGALLGALFGFIGHSTRPARLAIEKQIKDQVEVIENAYKVFQVQYTPAIDQLEQVRQQGVDALAKAGVTDIDRSRVGHVDQWVDKAEKEINAIEAVRASRQQMIGSGAGIFGVPEFETGGMVLGPSWQKYLAVVHGGESITPAIKQAGNAGMSAGNTTFEAGAIVVNVNAAPGMDAAAVANEVMLRIRRAAQDRGNRVPF